MRWGIALLFLVIPTFAHAEGAVAVGFTKSDTIVTTTAVSKSSAANAKTRALADCGQRGRDCRIVHEFKNTCVATVVFNERSLDIGTGNTADQAGDDALRMCQAKGTACTSEFAACDPADPTAQTEPVIPPPIAQTSPAPQQRPTSTAPSSENGSGWITFFVLASLAYGGYRYRERIKALFTPEEELAPRLTPSDADRESARRHVTAAWDYIQKSIGATKAVNLNTEGIEEIIKTLNLAAEHLLKARGFDPDTNIEVENVGTLTQPSLTGMLLFIEAGCETQLARKSPFAYFGNRHLYRAVAALHQAIGYEAQPMYYCNLAEAYAYLGKTESAREYVRKALDLDPDHIDSLQLETAIPTMKRLHPPPPFFELKVGIFVAAIAFTIISSILGYWYGVVPWLIIGIYYAARNELRQRLSSIWWTYSHFKHKKAEVKRKTFIQTLHEKRWKGNGSVWHDI